jgi:hypothetical protein
MNQRRSERVKLQLRVVVIAEMDQGKTARLDAFTLVVNAHGGLLEMTLKVVKGQKMILANPATGMQQSCRVVSTKSSQDGLFAVSFEFENPSPHFWPIPFPPTDWPLVEAKN